VEFVVDYLSLQYAHVFPYIPIDRRAQFVRCDLALQMHVRHLALGMNACIRAARAVYDDRHALDQGERARELALHGPLFALHLPAVKVGAVVLNCQLEVHG